MREGERGGPEVVFLHGFLGAPEQFGPVAARLPRDVSVAAVIVPGHGPDPEIPTASFLDVCADVTAGEGPARRRVLVGYSMGGRLALGAAASPRTAWDVVVAIGAHAGLSEPERSQKWREEESRAARVVAHGLRAFVDEWEREPLFASQAAVDTGSLALQRRMRLAHTPNGLAWCLRQLGSGAMPVLATSQIVTRVALVVGERDTRFVEHARRLLPRLSNAELHTVAGVGHNVILEAPGALAEIVMSAIEGARS